MHCSPINMYLQLNGVIIVKPIQIICNLTQIIYTYGCHVFSLWSGDGFKNDGMFHRYHSRKYSENPWLEWTPKKRAASIKAIIKLQPLYNNDMVSYRSKDTCSCSPFLYSTSIFQKFRSTWQKPYERKLVFDLPARYRMWPPWPGLFFLSFEVLPNSPETMFLKFMQ